MQNMDISAFHRLMDLRNDPRDAIAKHVFSVDTSGVRQGNGGPVEIRAAIEGGVTVLKLGPGGRHDFYFPYVRGAGSVTIDPASVVEGAIVMTDAMNGCALEVRETNNALIFYHDQNGVSMSPLADGQQQVCRIAASAYWDDPAAHRAAAASTQKGLVAPETQFLCVFRNAVWHVVCCGVSRVRTGTSQTLEAGLEPVGGRYRGSFSANMPLVQQ